MDNLIAIGIIVVILGASIAYIVKAKKSGVHCIGCPAGGSCAGHCSGNDSHVEVTIKSDVVNTGCGCSTGTGCNCTEDSACNCNGH